MSDLAKVFGERVKAVRTVRRLTQPDLADRAGVSVQWIKKIEAGKGSASFITIQSIADALSVPASALFGEEARDTEDQLALDIGRLSAEQRDWLLKGLHYLKRS